MTQQSLIVKTQSAVAAWGNRDEVREMDSRLAVALPNGQNLNQAERKALAQISVAHGLDPFIGEVWYIPGKGPQVGIKGLRRKAREAIHAEREASNFWGNHVEITDPDLRSRWQIPPGALAFEYRLFDTVTTEFYIKTIKELKEAGMPWEVVTQIVGDKPYTSGIGYWKPGESTKMTPIQCAQKRAESDAIKKRFDINLPLADDDAPGADTSQYAGEWTDTAPAERERQLNPVHADDAVEGEYHEQTDSVTPGEPPVIEPEPSTTNAQKLGRDSEGVESLIDAQPPQGVPTNDPRKRLIKHRDEASQLVDQLRKAKFEDEAVAMEKLIRNANISLERNSSAGTMHNNATTLSKSINDYRKLIAVPA